MKFASLLPLTVATASVVLSVANRPQLQMARVIDGDTLVLNTGQHVRLIGVDAPETGECWAGEATALLTKLTAGQNLRLETDFNEIDQFGRTLGYLFDAREKFVNTALLAAGAGEYFHDELNPKYSRELIAAANKAHDSRTGRWSGCAKDEKAGCNIKGNLDKWDVRRYILPESRHYPAAVVNLDHFDRWFCSESEAIRAGFIKERL